jgi:hypothetical protein
MTKSHARDAVSNATLTPALTAFPDTPALVRRAAIVVALGLAGCDSPTPEPRPPALKMDDAGATDAIINPPMPPMPPITGGDGGSQNDGSPQNDGATPTDGTFQDGGARPDGFVNDVGAGPDGTLFRDADGLQDIGKSLLDTGPGLDSNLPDIFGAPDAGPLQRD